MALYSIDHAVGVARDLQDRLSLRMANSAGINTWRAAQDAMGWPELFGSHGGNEAEGQPVLFIRLMNINPTTDIFGNTTYPFTPTQTQLAYELNSAGAPFPTTADYTTAAFEITRTGTVFQEIAIANGTAVTEASVNAATPVQTLKSIDWGFQGNT